MFKFPECFLQSDDYADLTPQQIFNFLSRLDYIDEVSENIGEWLTGNRRYWNNFDAFVDDLELDIAACQNLEMGSDDNTISNWFIHSLWKDENFDSGFKLELLPERIKELANIPLPPLQISQNEAELWLYKNKKAIDGVMLKAMHAETIPEFLSLLLIIDIVASKMLTAFYIFRFIPEK